MNLCILFWILFKIKHSTSRFEPCCVLTTAKRNSAMEVERLLICDFSGFEFFSVNEKLNRSNAMNKNIYIISPYSNLTFVLSQMFDPSLTQYRIEGNKSFTIQILCVVALILFIGKLQVITSVFALKRLQRNIFFVNTAASTLF